MAAVLLRENAVGDGWEVFRPTGGLVGGWRFYRDATFAAFGAAERGEDGAGDMRYGPVVVRDREGREGALLPDGSAILRGDAGERRLDVTGRVIA